MRREERRLVACLFIDVVGSTEHTLRLGPERLKAALGAVFGELRALIEREGGTVEKYIGDEIYALFGAPIGHEDDPARGLRAAEGARRWAHERQSSDVAFDIRVGLETGEAVVDLAATEVAHQQMSVGAVVNVASRLCHQAEPGQVLVGPTAHAATEDLGDFRAVGSVPLKGIGPTAVWELLALKTAPQRRRLPFVGRQSELELLAIARRRARDRSVLVLVSGPPGQGKTRLVEEFLAGRGDALVLAARCRPGGEIAALAPLRELVLGARSDADLGAVIAEAVAPPERDRVRETLAYSIGIPSSSALASVGKDERDDEIVNAWRTFLGGLSSRQPVVIWIEDLHWADPEIVRLIDRLSHADDPLLLIATARPEFAEAAGLRPTGDRFFIELEGLEPGAAGELAASAGNTDEQTVARAEGNPLFIVELARARELRGELPITLQGALGARLDELDTEDRSLLAHAAVVGETFSASDAAALTRREASAVGSALLRLVDRHYIARVDGRYRFHHSLLRDVAYGRLLVADRMRLHARCAAERAAIDDPEVVAHHWWSALGGPDAEWVWRDDPELPAMRRAAFAAHIVAGSRSAEVFALDRAVPLLERAFSFASNDTERGEAKRALGDAYANDLRGDPAWRAYLEARDHFRMAGAVPSSVYLGALKVRMRVGAFTKKLDENEVEAMYAEAEAAARASHDAGALARTLVYGAFRDMDPATAPGDRAKLNEALRISEGSDPATRREVLGWYANELLRDSELDAARRVMDDMDALAVPTNELDRMEHFRGKALLAQRTGDLPLLESIAAELVAMSRRMGPHLRTHADVYAVWAAVDRGDWAKVRELARETRRLVTTSPGTAFCSSAAILLAFGAAMEARAGRGDEARALATPIAAATYDAWVRSDLAAFALIYTGERAAGTNRELSSVAIPFAAVVAVAAGDHDRALAIASDLERRSHGGARFFAALAEAIREEVARDRTGATPAHANLRALGYVGWSELLEARA
ncbi:MAG TPA: AAA family ATPase [Candidatus Limnocylindria bacterium]|jgi:class 3 adenylate cyclase